MLMVVIAGVGFAVAFVIARRRGWNTKASILAGVGGGIIAYVLAAALFIYVLVKGQTTV